MVNQYCYSWDGKNYNNGTFNSAQEALDDAIKESVEHQADEGINPDSVYIAKAMTYQNSFFYPDAEIITEHMACNAYDQGGEHADDYPDFDKDAEAELTKMLHEVLDKWCTKHEISPSFHQVGPAVRYCLATAKPISIEELVKKVVDSNESAYDDHVSATVGGYEFELWKDPDCDNDWYIRVNPEGESYLYDGWWDDSSDKSTEDAVIEAIRGSGIFDND